MFGIPNVAQPMSSYSTIPIDEWVHLAAVFSATSQYQKIYINGELDAEIQSLNGIVNISSAFCIGKDYKYNVQYMNGLIDEIYIYNAPLSEYEIQNLYAQEED